MVDYEVDWRAAQELFGVRFIFFRIMQTMQSDVDASETFVRGLAHGKDR
jgi:hypothetical protein